MKTIYLYLIISMAIITAGCDDDLGAYRFRSAGFPTLGTLPPKGYTGLWVTYNDGAISSEENYVDGYRHGICRIWGLDGKLWAVCEFRNGRPWTGKWMLSEDYKDDIPIFLEGNPDYECIGEFYFVEGVKVTDPELERKKKNANLPPSGQNAPAETPPCQPTQ